MANNRMMIYCTKDLKFKYLGKYYPVGWYSVGDTPFAEYMDEFFEEHDDCQNDNRKGVDLNWGTGMFKLTTEIDWKGYMCSGCHVLFKRKPKWWGKGHEHIR